MLSGWNGSHLRWSDAFLTWLLYCCATLVISAIVISPALSVTGTLKKDRTESANRYKPKFLAEQSQQWLHCSHCTSATELCC